jgi:hypothetical protein
VLWIGEIEEDDGSKTYGLHIATADYPKEGSTTLVEFAAAPTPAPAKPKGCTKPGCFPYCDCGGADDAPDHSENDIKMVRVPRELASRLTSTDNHVRQTARRELRNMLLAGGAQ